MTRNSDNDDDKIIWRRVSRTVAPLKKGSSRPGQVESFETLLRLPPEQLIAKPGNPGRPNIRADKKTRRGKIDIGAKIDLHDMTSQQASKALRRAIIRSYNRNMSCVLVVTGKGLRGQGVLRRSLPGWLEHPDIRPVISEFAPAHIRHGGTGAWYVFLKNG